MHAAGKPLASASDRAQGPLSHAIPAEVSDEALCRRVGEGDESAFDLLVGRYQRRAYRIAWSLLGDADDARDVSQEAFVRVFERARSFAGRARFSTWFYRVLVNLCVDHRRRRRWWREMTAPWNRDGAPGAPVERQPAPSRDPLEGIEREQRMARVWAATGDLSPHQRAVLVLYAQEELPLADIASVLECSQATVRVHLHRALATLRTALRED